MINTPATGLPGHWTLWTIVALVAACFIGFQLARIYYRRTFGQSSLGHSPLSRATHDAALDLEDIARDLEAAIDRWQTGVVGIQDGDGETWDALVAHIRAARGDIHLRRQMLQQAIASTHPLTSSIRGKAEMTAHLGSLLSLQLRYDQPFSLALLRSSSEAESDQSATSASGFEPHSQRLGATIAAQVRETDLIARYDHDTYAVVMPQTSPDAACQLIERIRDVMETTTSADSIDAAESPWHVFGGVATADYQDNVESLLARATEATDQAKSHGANRIHRHNGHATQLVPEGFAMPV